ncbi:Endochitinase [Arachis hypogaea]|nr:Endochitinase [Arachis hypogaea]
MGWNAVRTLRRRLGVAAVWWRGGAGAVVFGLSGGDGDGGYGGWEETVMDGDDGEEDKDDDEQCGRQANGALCPNSLCCSQWGWCGTTDPYCGSGCQSQCKGSTPSNPSPPPPPPTPIGGGGGGSGGGDVANILTSSMFDQMLKHRNDPSCPGKGFYTYDAFIAAARTSAGFGTTGDDATRKREIAAFLGQTSHETTGGWPSAPDGPYAWGYCFLSEVGATADYCVASDEWPCSPGKKYYGRGPIQISYNYNYGPAGKAIGVDLLNNPDLVATNPTVSFLTALWFWMTPQGSKPSCHDVITGKWTPSDADKLAGRVPGFGVITNIINGGIECGHGSDSRVQDRIGFYQRYCQMLGVSPGDNLDCGNQRSFA